MITALAASMGVWAVAEFAIQRRNEGRDRSFFVMWLGGTLSILLAVLGRKVHAPLPGPRWASFAIGIALIWIGLALRLWAVRTLGRFFTVKVSILEGHRVIDTGPYRFVRHPSYTGLLLTYLGFGIGLDSWASVAGAIVPPLAAAIWRIADEEEVLLRELGDPYREYARGRRRLLPGVW